MFDRLKKRNEKRRRRNFRIRKPLRKSGHPRLSVSKTNKHVYAQIVDDENSKTIVGLGTLSKDFKETEFSKKSKASAREIGKKLAEAAMKSGVKKVVFDRGRHKYHGIIAELADGAREGGLQF
ncbi:MAG: 50S ribosomal protein L18 [Simkaniaceae bacterium]